MKTARPKTENELKKECFKLLDGFTHLYINDAGNVYDTNKKKYLKPTSRNYIKPGNKYLSVPKLVLMTFKGEPYKRGQIHYIDGKMQNMSVKNIKYTRLYTPEQNNKVNKDNLFTAIRCYFEVELNFKIRDTFKTRFFLQTIIDKRGFINYHRKLEHIQIYLTYMGLNLFTQKSITQTAHAHGLPVRDCLVIVNSFTNLLISEILHELKKGTLHVNEYKPKKPTKTDNKRQINEYLTEHGQKPIPLRKKSLKESLKDFEMIRNEIKNENATKTK